jgi:hypothetical protein
MQSRFCFLLIISSPNCRFKCKAREAKVGLNSTGLDYWTGRPDFSNVNLCYINCELLQMIQLPKKYDKNFIDFQTRTLFIFYTGRIVQVLVFILNPLGRSETANKCTVCCRRFEVSHFPLCL